MLKSLLLVFFGTLIAGPAIAQCPSKAPSLKVSTSASDQRVGASWLAKTLTGRRVQFDDGTEHYQPDGSYYYRAGTERWDAPSVKFYDTGVRCIGYSNPRYDLYVVNNGQLVLINANGDRFVGKLLE